MPQTPTTNRPNIITHAAKAAAAAAAERIGVMEWTERNAGRMIAAQLVDTDATRERLPVYGGPHHHEPEPDKQPGAFYYPAQNIRCWRSIYAKRAAERRAESRRNV